MTKSIHNPEGHGKVAVEIDCWIKQCTTKITVYIGPKDRLEKMNKRLRFCDEHKNFTGKKWQPLRDKNVTR